MGDNNVPMVDLNRLQQQKAAEAQIVAQRQFQCFWGCVHAALSGTAGTTDYAIDEIARRAIAIGHAVMTQIAAEANEMLREEAGSEH